MKRMHVHVAVDELERSIGFYSALFAAEPVVVKPDYAKWMLDDPRVNFAISTRGKQPGLDHLGIQVESKGELAEVYARLRNAGGSVLEQGDHLLLRAVGEIVDRRPRGHRVGDFFHHRREHRLRYRHRAGRPRGARQGVLRAGGRPMIDAARFAIMSSRRGTSPCLPRKRNIRAPSAARQREAVS